MQKIKLSSPNIGFEEIEAVSQVLRSGNLLYGQEGLQFEEELKQYIGVSHAVLVSSGTAALHLALLAHGLGKGDAVIIPGFTFPATMNVVMMVGAVPIIVDVNPITYCIEPALIEESIVSWRGAEKIKAIIPVHEFGHPADMSTITRIAEKYALIVIEDAACAIGGAYQGIKVGNLGNTACFSFHPRKVLTTGEGGLVTTEDGQLAERLRLLRNHGSSTDAHRRNFVAPGLNYRLTDIQAALGRIQLRKLNTALAARRALYQLYDRQFCGHPTVFPPTDCPGHSWQTYMVVLDGVANRDKVIQMLGEHGIESNIAANALSQLAYVPPVTTPVSQRLFTQGLALPFFETMTKETCQRVAKTLIDIVETRISA